MGEDKDIVEQVQREAAGKDVPPGAASGGAEAGTSSVGQALEDADGELAPSEADDAADG